MHSYGLCSVVQSPEPNCYVRRHFIGDVLEIPLKDIKSVRIVNPFLWKRYKNQKLGILDIQLVLNDNTKINIEIQLKHYDHWEARTVFYLAKMLTADLRHGENYGKIKKCIAITILDFKLDDGKGYHNAYVLRDRKGNVYTDILELHTIELRKNPDKENPNALDEWHSLFNAKTEEDLDMIKSRTKNKGIMEAVKELKEINLVESLRYEHELRLKAKRDREAEDDYLFRQGIEEGRGKGIEEGRREGIEEGRKEGIEEGRREGIEEGIKILISTLREHKVTEEQIVENLVERYGLSREEASRWLEL